MFEFGNDKLAGSFCWMIAADPRLCVSFQLVECYTNALAMRFADPMVPAYECRQRDGLWGGECGVPARPVLHRCDCFSVLILVIVCRLDGAVQVVRRVCGCWPWLNLTNASSLPHRLRPYFAARLPCHSP